MLLNLKELLLSLSYTLDLAYMGYSPVMENHTKRVALLSAEVAGYLYLKESYKLEAATISIFNHIKDCCKIKTDKTDDLLKVKDMPSLTTIANVCDALDFRLKTIDLKKADYIDFSLLFASSAFDSNNKMLMNVLFLVLKNNGLLNSLQEENIVGSLNTILPDKLIEINFSDLSTIVSLLLSILFRKMPGTLQHSINMSKKVEFVCDYYKFAQYEKNELILASLLHDIGKLALPTSILDKEAPLTKEEFELIKKHPFYTNEAISFITNFSSISNWASNHHEKLDGSGYPKGLKHNELDFNSRLLCCIDIYQALIEDRPYRKAMTSENAIDIMLDMSSQNLIDNKIVKDLKNIFP